MILEKIRLNTITTLSAVFALYLGCSNHLYAESFEGTSSGISVDYEIDLPEGYDKGNGDYPVIYVLHSWGRTHNTQFKCTVTEKCDDNNESAKIFMLEAVAAGKLEPSILVYPNGMKSSFFANSVNGERPIETSIIKDLVPHIESNFRARPGRENRAIIGLRLGGYGAVMYGVKYPELFAATVSVAGALHDWTTCTHPDDKMPSCLTSMFNDNYSSYLPYSPWYQAQQNTAAIKNHDLGILLIMGDDDEMKMRAETFGKLLTTLEIPYAFEQVKDCTGEKGPNRPGRNFNCIVSKATVSPFIFIGEQMKKAQQTQ